MNVASEIAGRWRPIILVALLSAGTAAWGEKVDLPLMPQHRDENGKMLKRSDSLIAGAITYSSDANADVDGGVTRGAAYLQRLGLIVDADLDRLLGWDGASAHVSVHAINGIGLSGRRVGNVLTVSGLEAEPAVRLFNLWIEQKLGQSATVRLGQFTAGQEFALSPTAALFVNSTFGWPASFANDLPSGGPAYPLASPGIRFAASPDRSFALRLAVFAGDPAGPGTGDPQRRDLHGLNGFGLAGKPFVVGEISHSASGDDPAWSLTLGGWMHGGNFNDVASSAPPFKHVGNWSVYAVADGRLWRSGQRTVRGFLRTTAGPADRNPLDLYLDGGLSLTAPLHGRCGDTLGLAFAIARLSPRWRPDEKARAGPSSAAVHLPRYEAVIEASWQWNLGLRAYLQPNVQLALHPSAALLAQTSAAPSPSHALVVGVRSSLRL